MSNVCRVECKNKIGDALRLENRNMIRHIRLDGQVLNDCRSHRITVSDGVKKSFSSPRVIGGPHSECSPAKMCPKRENGSP